MREIDRAQSREWNKANVDIDQRREERKVAAAEIRCAVCGKPFLPSNAAITCSPECSKELAKQRQAEFEKKKRSERNERHKELLKERISKMTPDELAAYRADINAKARERYQRRKNK